VDLVDWVSESVSDPPKDCPPAAARPFPHLMGRRMATTGGELAAGTTSVGCVEDAGGRSSWERLEEAVEGSEPKGATAPTDFRLEKISVFQSLFQVTLSPTVDYLNDTAMCLSQ
jgi:hypothetical protein